MTRDDYNRYTMSIVDEPCDMPFLAGGYTQTDWRLINKTYTDWDDYDYGWESCSSLEEQFDFIRKEIMETKPYWA